MRITLKPLFQQILTSSNHSKALPTFNQQTVSTVVGVPQKEEPRRDTLGYVIRLLNRHMHGQHKVFLLALIMLLAEASMSIFEEFPLAYLIDYLSGNRPELLSDVTLPAFISHRILTVALLTSAIVVMAMINSLGDSMAEIFLARGGQMMAYNLRTALYKHLQRLSLAFHDQRRTGDILTRITGDVSEIEDFVIGSLSDIFGSLLILIGTLAVLFYTSWQIAVLALIIVPLMAVVSNYFSKRIKKAAKSQRACEGEMAASSQEMLASIRVIQTYGRGDYELERFAQHNQKNVAAAFRLAVLQARFSWVVSVSQALAISGTIWICFWLLNYGVITIGTVVFFTRLIQKMFKPTRKIIKEWNTIAKMYASVERIGELLDRKPAVSDGPNATVAPPFRGHIQFQGVNFTYPSNVNEMDEDESIHLAKRQALTNVNFDVPPGGVMALVGHTGAGKSTIIQLLPRLYDPSKGSVLIDGVDIRQVKLESLRDQISVVLQETTLFTGTVAENIAYGRMDATREEVIQAAIQANAHGFIEHLPDGYDTVLGERGANLSGGQRQRIAIARAFIRNTPILILDEPTTGLDAESAELVLLALRLLMRGKTTIIISHDFKLVRHADSIVVLKDGKINQMGTHRDLLDAGGIYADLYIKQFGEIKSAEEDEDSFYNLLQSPQFRHRWPTICTAFDADVMQTHLQEALVAQERDQYRIVRCKPGKARFLADAGCLLRYSLQLEHVASAEQRTALVLARIFPTNEEAEIYLRQRLAPLVAHMAGRPEIEPFSQPVALVNELNMAVSVFPIDGELPALIAVTDRVQMTDFFQRTLPDDPDTNLKADDCTITVGHYGRQHRCVLRYEVQRHLSEAVTPQSTENGESSCERSQPVRQTIYGKVAADDRCKIVGAVLTSLQWRLNWVRTKRHFRIPRIVGYWPQPGLILLESIPGQPQISEMLQARIEGDDESRFSGLTLEDAVQDCARVAAALHKVDIQFSETRTLESELDDLHVLMPAVQQYSLGLAMQLQHTVHRLRSYAESTDPLPVCFSHGDYTYTQLLFDERTCGLVDFDTVCQAEPALDLGQFLAYMRLAARKAEFGIGDRSGMSSPPDVEALGAQFIDTYAHCAGFVDNSADQLRARVAVYEVISLMRITLHSWQKMKSSRLEIAAELLEERIASLS